jgi:competence protein ComEC
MLYDDRFRNDFCVYFIDVGMGEAALIEAPKGVRILIDGGGSYSGDFDTGSRIVMPFLLSRKILTLDYVINSHIHADHIGGLPSIVRLLRVKRFAATAYLAEHPEFASLSRLLRQRGTSLELWKSGDVYQVAPLTEAAVFHPPPNVTFDNLNNTSLVIRITHEAQAFLFPGDIDEEVEGTLLRSGTPLKSDVLKIPHHGSRTSSSLPFLSAVRPVLAILTGGGMQNVPSVETLERYLSLSIPVLRADRQGPIAVCSRNGRLTYKVSQR